MTDQAVLRQEQAIARLRDDLRGSPDGTLRAGNRYLHDADVRIVCAACEAQTQEIARLRENEMATVSEFMRTEALKLAEEQAREIARLTEALKAERQRVLEECVQVCLPIAQRLGADSAQSCVEALARLREEGSP